MQWDDITGLGSSKGWGWGSAGAGIAAGVLASSGVGLLLPVGFALASTAMGLFGKDAAIDEQEKALKKQRKQILADKSLALNQASTDRRRANAASLLAYREGEFDIGRKIKSRSESNLNETVKTLNTGFLSANSELVAAESKIGQIDFADFAIAAADVAVTATTAGAATAARTADLLEKADKAKDLIGTVNKVYPKGVDKWLYQVPIKNAYKSSTYGNNLLEFGKAAKGWRDIGKAWETRKTMSMFLQPAVKVGERVGGYNEQYPR